MCLANAGWRRLEASGVDFQRFVASTAVREARRERPRESTSDHRKTALAREEDRESRRSRAGAHDRASTIVQGAIEESQVAAAAAAMTSRARQIPLDLPPHP